MGEMQNRSLPLSVNAAINVGSQESRVTAAGGAVVLRECDESFGVLRPLLILARQRRDWSPALIAGELWRLLTNIDKQLYVSRRLMARCPGNAPECLL
jgi:hypothetical protein